MAQVVQPGRILTGNAGDPQGAQDAAERGEERLQTNGFAPLRHEQRVPFMHRQKQSASHFEVALKTLADLWSERDVAAFVELRSRDEQRLTIHLQIAQAQALNLP